ncbi:MAG: hypothetical protein ABS46_15540 [Cytophagaceae bacterium SCN 52-12]|nr:MAG: hypothetical protein ABS46_15540 [Cytophagaceae bacterium SCN 52-12]
MKHRAAVFFFYWLLFLSPVCLPGQDFFVCRQLHDSRSGEAGWFGSGLFAQRQAGYGDNFDVHYYRAYWQVDPSVRQISGRVGVYFTIVSDSESIILDLHDNLGVTAVSSNGQPLTFVHSNHRLEVTFPATRPAGTKDSVYVTYGGVPPVSDFNAFQQSSHGSPPVPILFTLSEPFGSRDWWPCKNGLDDKADSVDIFIRHPAAYGAHVYRAASNGIRQSETAVEGGAATLTHWKHGFPIASYLVAFAITNYTVFDQLYPVGDDQVLMETYCFPQSSSEFEAGASSAMDMMNFFSQKFGKYPFAKEKYGHTQFTWGGGMEHQTNSFMGNMNRTLVAHELAHQWFGNKITCGSWEDVWLNEGFASYLTSLYLESKDPWATSLTNRRSEINLVTSQPGGSVKVDDITNTGRIFNSRLSYYKGARLLFMLQWILGDDVFFEAVNQYLNDPALSYGYAVTADLKRHLEEAGHTDLDYFFEQWFEGEGYPSYQISWYASGNDVSFNIRQTASQPSSVSFFRLPLPLLVSGANPGEQKLVVFDNTYNGQSFIENVGFEVVSVDFDPDAWLVTRNNTVVKANDPLPVRFEHVKSGCEEGIPTIEWKAADEHSVAYYSIQSGNPAGNDWREIARILPDTAYQDRIYRYVVSLPCNARAYYRLVEFDLSGAVTISPVMNAGCPAGRQELIAAPNPFSGKLTISLDAHGEDTVLLTVTDQTGRIRFSKAFLPSEIPLEIDLSFLPAGVYHLATGSGSTGQKNVRTIIRQ